MPPPPPPPEETAPPAEEAPVLPVETSVTSGITTFSIQVDTPDADSVQRAELAVSRVSGVTSALTTSLALGGTSVMRVTYMGDPASFQAALQAQGWQVSGSGTSLRIAKSGGD
jgi:hypothetical protein